MTLFITIKPGVCLITRYSEDSSKKNVVIPRTNSKGEIIKYIGPGAYSGKKIKILAMNNEIETVGRYGIADCKLLQYVKPSKKLKELKDYCLSENYYLRCFNFGPNLEKMGDGVFKNDISLEVADMSRCTKLRELGDYCFFGNDSLQIVKNPPKLQYINDFCFARDEKLKNFCFQNSIVNIGDHAFEFTSLRKVVLGKSTNKIGKYCFANNQELRTVIFNEVLSYIGDYCFANDYSLTEIDIPGTVKKISRGCFNCCTSLRTATMHEGAEVICYKAFADSGLSGKHFLPKSIKKICKQAYKGNSELEEVYIPPGVKEIEDGVFDDCPKLVICGEFGGLAHAYAKRNKIKFQRI